MTKEECCGCAACAAVCPREAIVMEEDEEGFRYPRIMEEKCVHCSLCERVCPMKRKEGPDRDEKQG